MRPMIARGLPLCCLTMLLLAGCAVQQQSDVPAEQGPSQPAVHQPTVTALGRMLEDARSQLAAGQWQAAIATAERGLRIDRREPELYFLLAKSYQQLADLERAKQFARQGLRFAGKADEPLAAELNDLLFALEHPAF